MLHTQPNGFIKAIGSVIIFLFFITENYAQPTLNFSQTSTVNGSSFSEVQNPVANPNCDPPENIFDAGNSFFNIPALERIWGGAYTYIKRGLPNCKISAQGTGNVWMEGDGSSAARVQWWCHSNTQYDCYDPDCPWYAIDTSSVTATVVIKIGGVPNGTPVEVSYRWKHFSSIANRPEAVSEDNAEIQNASLNLFGIEGFGNQFNLSGPTRFAQKRTGNDSVQTMSMVAGDSLVIDVSAMTIAFIYPPPYTPQNPREDDASADFFGYVEIEVDTPGSSTSSFSSCPNPELLYSVDIGSDVEFSDPTPNVNEVLDPGDLYVMGGAAPVPFFDDTTIFGFDPNPSLGNPAGTCFPGPLQQWQGVLNFDLDGADRMDYNLFNNNSNYGAGKPSIAPYQTDCIYSPSYMMLSYDEDRGINFSSALLCDVPSAVGLTPNEADSVFVKGTASGNDEVMYANLTNISGTPTYYGTAGPYLDEQGVSPLLSPSPLAQSPPDMNDDVDALDYVFDPAQCSIQYFSVDHEAYYIHNNDTLRPGFIYQVSNNNTVQKVIDPVLHLGLLNDVDIDAFEFSWLYDSTQQRNGLALVFSVSSSDPFSPFDYTGGLDPGALYASFLNGVSFEMLPAALPGNIDAVTFGCEPFYGYGATYVPPVLFVGMNETEQNNFDLNLYPNPNKGSFNMEFSLKETSVVNAIVIDMNGKTVWANTNLSFPAGSRKITVPLTEVSNGLYFVELQISSGDKVNTLRRKISVMK